MIEEPKLKTSMIVNCGYVKRHGYKEINGKKVSTLVCENMVILQKSIDQNMFGGKCNKCGCIRTEKV